MNFETNEDQKMVRETVRRFAEDSLGPRAEEWDAEQQLPRRVFDELRDLGLLGLTLPARMGGSGLDDPAALLAVEELARQDASTAISVVAHSVLVGQIALELGIDELVADLASGQVLGTWSMSVDAEDTGLQLDSESTVRGRAADVLQCRNADVALLFARDPDSRRVALLVEREQDDMSVCPNDGPLGCRAADLGNWTFADASLPGDALLSSREGYSDALVASVFSRAQTYLGAIAVGVARGALEEGLAYANDREQFGRPISRFQVTQFKLADMTTRVDAARLMVLGGAEATASDGRRSRAAQLASTVALEVADEAVQLHGGYGYTSEYPVERYLRDARTIASLLGGRSARLAASTDELSQAAPLFS